MQVLGVGGKPEEGIRCSASGVTDRCELPDVGAWKPAPSLWKKSKVPPLVYLLLLKVICLFISPATMGFLRTEKDSERLQFKGKNITSWVFNTIEFVSQTSVF